MELNILKPKKDFTNLYGREYKFGTQDCFEALRDYLSTQNIIIPRRAAFEDGWYEKDLDYFCPEVIKDWKHKEIELKDIQKNDVLTFSIYSAVANHCGVYLGDNIFYHHAVNRLSCRENLYPLWIKYIDRAYRYVA
jgi:hypothetical protein